MEAGSITNQSDELRAGLRGIWGAVAPGWREHADFVDARAAGLTRRMIELTEPRAGERALELACGPGSVGIELAPLVQEVVLSDVAPQMTAIAAERAAARGLGNVTTVAMDMEQIGEPEASFDLVYCREGLMLVPDPARAASEIARVLKPGGRAAISVWGPRERNPWLGIVLDQVSAQLGAPVPPPGVPGPFSLDSVEAFHAALDGAGFAELRVEELEVPLRTGSFDEWWSRTAALAGPLSKLLEGLPGEAASALRARLQDAAAPYESADGMDFPGVVLLASARR